jgi:hypothetical protein
MGRSGVPLRTRMRSPSFRAKNFSTCTRSPTARGSSHASLYVMGRCCLLVSELDRHLEIGPVSQLDTWPVVSPVNASPRPSRDAVHHLGSGRLAIPYPMGDFHLLFFASKTGALGLGSFSTDAAEHVGRLMSASARKQRTAHSVACGLALSVMDDLARRANHFALSEIMSSPTRRNIYLPFFRNA